jgi:hypothetical protein
MGRKPEVKGLDIIAPVEAGAGTEADDEFGFGTDEEPEPAPDPEADGGADMKVAGAEAAAPRAPKGASPAKATNADEERHEENGARPRAAFVAAEAATAPSEEEAPHDPEEKCSAAGTSSAARKWAGEAEAVPPKHRSVEKGREPTRPETTNWSGSRERGAEAWAAAQEATPPKTTQQTGEFMAASGARQWAAFDAAIPPKTNDATAWAAKERATPPDENVTTPRSSDAGAWAAAMEARPPDFDLPTLYLQKELAITSSDEGSLDSGSEWSQETATTVATWSSWESIDDDETWGPAPKYFEAVAARELAAIRAAIPPSDEYNILSWDRPKRESKTRLCAQECVGRSSI